MSTSQSNYVAVTEHVQEVGAIYWWRLRGSVAYELFIRKMAQAGMRESWLPSRPTPLVLLSRAMNQVAHGSRQLVRPVKRGHALIQELVSGEEITHKPIITAVLDQQGLRVTEHVRSDVTLPLLRKLHEQYKIQEGLLQPSDLTGWLPWLIHRVGDAVTLRPGGGFYFVPRSHLENWRPFVQAIQGCTSHAIHEVPALSSEEAVDAILDAVIAEAEVELNAFEADLTKGLGKRAIATRERACFELKEKIERYERLLNVRAEDLHSKLSRVQGNLAASLLTKTENLPGITLGV